jgi:LacI family transcriptional regulator
VEPGRRIHSHPATLRDVAREAGVSLATVSHVINGTRFVADETRQRVLAAIDRLHYEVNSVARSLKRNHSQAIGLLISDITNPYFTSLVCGVEDVAREAGYTVVLCNADEDPERELRYLQLLRQKRVDGILMAPTGVHHRYLDHLVEVGFPLVCFDRALPDLPCDSVVLDNVGGAREAVSHLIHLGHRRIGIITGLPRVGTTAGRLEGYRQALRAHGIAEEPELIRQGNGRRDGGFTQTLALLDLVRPPTALFTTNNLMTLGALAALAARGVRVPGDMAVVGFDDFEWTDVLRPYLTTVAQPTYEIGTTAARLLLARIEHRAEGMPRQVVLSPRLIARESCGSGYRPGPAALEATFGRVGAR